jgi:hypothetical protein
MPSRQPGLFQDLLRQVLFDFPVARDGDAQGTAAEDVVRALRADPDETRG